MNNKKILFTDLDGTLLCTDKSLSAGNRQAVLRALADGHHIVFSTGRATLGVAHLLRQAELYLPGTYLICFNGAIVYDVASQKILYSTVIAEETILRCFALAEEMGVHLQTYGGEGASTVLALRQNPYLDTYANVQALPYRIVPDLSAALAGSSPKMLAIEPDHEKMKRFRTRVEEVAGDRLDVFMSSDVYLELVAPGTSKGNAVRFLCRHLHIPIANSVAAGDAENDISMLDAAGIGVAMVNGTQAAKSHADYVTVHDNDHDGVAEIVEKFILS